MVAFPITIPAVEYDYSTINIDWHDSSYDSALSRKTTVVSIGGGTLDLWRGLLRTKPLKPVMSRKINAFLHTLRGREGTFYVSDPDYIGPANETARAYLESNGNPLVKGAGQAGRSIILKGLPLNTAEAVTAGDYIEVGGEFKQVTVGGDSDAGGEVTIEFEPILRASPADNAVVNILTPRLIARLQQAQEPIETETRQVPVAFAWIEAVL